MRQPSAGIDDAAKVDDLITEPERSTAADHASSKRSIAPGWPDRPSFQEL
jgi:hypothetical protein